MTSRTSQQIAISDPASTVNLKLNVVKYADDMSGLACFSIIRNERYFLPHFLRHYRGLGISHFIFYDDSSDDGSRELLLDESDCTILTSHYGFRQYLRNGQPFLYIARNLIPEHFVSNGWCLTVDADEFLLLPSRFASLGALIEELDARGESCVLAPMVDLFPATLAQRQFDRALPPFEGRDWWFDRDPAFARVPGIPGIEGKAGGVRHRILKMLRNDHPDRFRRIFSHAGRVFYSRLWKVPLLKTGQGILRLNTHSVDAPVAPDIQLAIAHFKFYPGIDEKIKDALATRSYARDSFEYRVLDAAIECFPDGSLVCDRSLRFHSPLDFEQQRLMFA